MHIAYCLLMCMKNTENFDSISFVWRASRPKKMKLPHLRSEGNLPSLILWTNRKNILLMAFGKNRKYILFALTIKNIMKITLRHCIYIKTLHIHKDFKIMRMVTQCLHAYGLVLMAWCLWLDAYGLVLMAWRLCHDTNGLTLMAWRYGITLMAWRLWHYANGMTLMAWRYSITLCHNVMAWL